MSWEMNFVGLARLGQSRQILLIGGLLMHLQWIKLLLLNTIKNHFS